jgi:hypothetical protein
MSPAALVRFVLGLSIVVKDLVVVVVVLTPLFVAVARRWTYRGSLWTVACSALVPTRFYLAALATKGSLGERMSQGTFGVQRLLGSKEFTEFDERGHPSLFSTLLRQSTIFGLSYVVCGLEIVMAIYLILLRNSPDVRLIACINIAEVLTLVYATLFGAVET